MNKMDVRWAVVLSLACFALIRPLLSFLGVFDNDFGPLVGAVVHPLFVTLLISAVWIGAVVVLREPNPILTLLVTGGMYGVFAIVLQQLGFLVYGAPESVPAMPLLAFGWVAILLTNVLWGAVAGLVGAGILRLSHPNRAEASL